MKKKITTIVLTLIALSTTTAFVRYQNGIAGYTNAPGEVSCNACHSGGSSAAAGTTISALPSFTNNEYVAGQNYTITVDLAAAGFSQFGFGCEILNGSNSNSGSMHTAGTGVKFLNSGSRKNAVHTAPKSGTGGVSFSFEWTAPSNGDAATFYVAGNAVNGNSNTSLDFPMTPVTLEVLPAPATEPVGIKEQSSALNRIAVYPNPASDLTQVSFYLTETQTTQVELIEMNGRLVRNFESREQGPGLHTQTLDLHGIASGVYFIKVSANGRKAGQQMISVQ